MPFGRAIATEECRKCTRNALVINSSYFFHFYAVVEQHLSNLSFEKWRTFSVAVLLCDCKNIKLR